MVCAIRLPGAKELRIQERASVLRLHKLFARIPVELAGHKELGLRRLEMKFRMAVNMLRFMKEHGVKTTGELAELLYCDGPYRYALEMLRYPVAFRPASKKREDEYLLVLCDLEWHPLKKRWIPSSATL